MGRRQERGIERGQRAEMHRRQYSDSKHRILTMSYYGTSISGPVSRDSGHHHPPSVFKLKFKVTNSH